MRTYVGARYVPLIVGKWNNEIEYEPLSIVTHEGNSFTSKKAVPTGIDINNTEYWVSTGNYNAQIEEYRKDVAAVMDTLNSKPGIYSNVSELRSADNLEIGMMVITLGYYEENDGGGSNYYVRAKLDDDVDNGGSTLIIGNHTLILLGDVVNVAQFGAKGDGITDDYNTLQKCFNTADRIYIPNKTYYTSKGLTFTGKSIECEGVLTSNNAITIITIGTASNLKRNITGNVRVKGNNTVGQIGVLLCNMSNSNILSEAQECETGIKIYAAGKGVIGNVFSFGKILGNLTGIDIDADTDGWVNQNIFMNADIQNFSSDERAFIKLKMEDTNHVINGNIFISFNLEGMNTNSKAIHGKCSCCVFINARLEAATENCVELLPGSDYNNFINPIILPLDTNVFSMSNTNFVESQQYAYGSTYGICYKSHTDNDLAFSTREKDSNFAFANLTSYIRTNGSAMFSSMKVNGNVALASGFMVGRTSSPEGAQMGYAGCLCLCTDVSDYGLYIKTSGTPESLSNTGWVKLNS